MTEPLSPWHLQRVVTTAVNRITGIHDGFTLGRELLGPAYTKSDFVSRRQAVLHLDLSTPTAVLSASGGNPTGLRRAGDSEWTWLRAGESRAVSPGSTIALDKSQPRESAYVLRYVNAEAPGQQPPTQPPRQQTQPPPPPPHPPHLPTAGPLGDVMRGAPTHGAEILGEAVAGTAAAGEDRSSESGARPVAEDSYRDARGGDSGPASSAQPP